MTYDELPLKGAIVRRGLSPPSPFLCASLVCSVFLTRVSCLPRTLIEVQGAHPLRAQQNPLAALLHAPKMAPVDPGLDLDLDPNPGKTPFCC